MTSYVFGPVPSRRLGRSLGVDLVPLKTCSYDCIYCQLGRTKLKTTERREWVPTDVVLSEVREKLDLRPDYVTLSGSGEPTLNCRLAEVVDHIKCMTTIPVAVLTNGSLLWQEEVRRQLADADLVIPSLDAGEEEAFLRVNRPHREISFERLVHGLIAFREEFRGDYWLEVFLLAGYTADDTQAAMLVECVDRIRPDRVQLNTVARPPAESRAIAVSRQRMHELAARFKPPAEVLGRFRGSEDTPETALDRDLICDLLRRRPCTPEDIAAGLGVHLVEVVKHLEELADQGLLVQTWSEGRLYCHPAGSCVPPDLTLNQDNPNRTSHG